jgi:hypothetical protein
MPLRPMAPEPRIFVDLFTLAKLLTSASEKPS